MHSRLHPAGVAAGTGEVRGAGADNAVLIRLMWVEIPFSSMQEDNELKEIKEMLRDLVWLNAVIATELIQITENTSMILRTTAPPEACIAEHAALRATALDIADRYKPGTMLRQHVEEHQ